MRHFNRVFLSITLLLGTVFAGAVLPTQAGAVGFAPPSGVAIASQSYTESATAGGFDITATWASGPANGETGTYYVQVETGSYYSGTFATEVAVGTCIVTANACTISITGYNGIPSSYPLTDTQARAKFELRFDPSVAYYDTGQQFWMHKSFLQLSNTYVSIDESSTTYGDEVTLSGWMRAETDTAVNTGHIYFYDLGDGKFTNTGETITGGDTATAIGSCEVQEGGIGGLVGPAFADYPDIWSGGCQYAFPNDGSHGKFHTGTHHIVAKYVDDMNEGFRSYQTSWSDGPRNFEVSELPYVDLTVEKAVLDFAPSNPSNILYGADVPDYAEEVGSTVTGYEYGTTEANNWVFNGTGWGYVTLPECTSIYQHSSESGTVDTYEVTCDTAGAENYDYTYDADYGDPAFDVNPAPLTVTPDNQTIEYGDPVPSDSFYTLNYSGFYYGEDESVLDPAAVCGSEYTESTTVGDITITCAESGVNGNYDVDASNEATLTITRAPLDIYAPKYNYDETTPADNSVDYSPYTVTYSEDALDFTTLEEDTVFVGFKNDENVDNLSTFACSSDYSNLTHVGEAGYADAAINCEATATNYAITLHEGAYLVNPETLTVYSTNNITVPRGSLDVIYPYGVEGFVNGETQFDAMNYIAPSCSSGYTPESAANSIFAISCGGLSANDYVAVYETGTAVSVQAPAEFPTTTNLFVEAGSTSIYQGGTIHLHAIVCAGANAHPDESGLCPGASGPFTLPTILPTSPVVFSWDGSPIAGYCQLIGDFTNRCDIDLTTPDGVETGTHTIQATYYGTSHWGYSHSETASVEILETPITTWPYSITYHVNNGSESSTTYLETGTAATWPVLDPLDMGLGFTSYAASHTFDYWFLNSETYTVGDSWSNTGGTTKHLYGHWSSNVYTVTYDYNGGSGTPAAYETFTVGSGTLTLPTPDSRANYTFNGWYSNAGLTNFLGNSGETWTPTSSTTIYAKWTNTGGSYVPPANVVATVSVNSSTVTYNGASHGVTATTSPAGLAVTITYNGSTTQPTNAGTYAVVATITSAGYTGTATGTLVINKATPTIAWSSPASVEEGTTLSGAQLNAVGSVPGTLTYSPAAGYTPSVGSNTLSVTLNPTDSTNWNNASASVVLSVTATAVEPTPDPAPAPVLKNLVLSFKLSSAKISAADLAKITEAALDNIDAVITIVGYAQPSGNKAADLKLSRARANAVKAQILALYPDATITIIAKGSTINKACKKSLNKCAIVSVE